MLRMSNVEVRKGRTPCALALAIVTASSMALSVSVANAVDLQDAPPTPSTSAKLLTPLNPTRAGGMHSSINPFSRDGKKFLVISASKEGRSQAYQVERSGRRTLVSSTSDGKTFADRVTYVSYADSDEHIVFVASGADLGPEVSRWQPQLYLKDLRTGQLRLVSANAQGVPADDEVGDPVVLPDGTIAFNTTATNLTATTRETKTVLVNPGTMSLREMPAAVKDGNVVGVDCLLADFASSAGRALVHCTPPGGGGRGSYVVDWPTFETASVNKQVRGDFISSDATQVAYAALRGKKLRVWKTYVWQTRTGKARLIPKTGGLDRVSPDFRYVAGTTLVGKNMAILLTRMSDGKQWLMGTRRGHLSRTGAVAVAFTSDSRRLVLISDGSLGGKKGYINLYVQKLPR